MKKFFKRRGQATVEFTLLLPFFALVLFSTVYVGFFVLDYVTLDNAAAQAARHAALDTEHHALQTEDITKIKGTKLFLSWYELKDNCAKISRGNINATGAFEEVAEGNYIRVTIRADIKSEKQDTILKGIIPDAYTVLKVAEIKEGD